MDWYNLVVLLIFIFMEDQMLSNSGLQSQNLWLCSQFLETLGRSPPLSGPISSSGQGSCQY